MKTDTLDIGTGQIRPSCNFDIDLLQCAWWVSMWCGASVDQADGTGRDFVGHWNWAASKGLINRNTAAALRAAVSRILAIEGDDLDTMDIRSLDVDLLLDRFENLAKKDFTPGSLSTYRSRFKRAHQLYLSYLDDPRNYRPQVRERVSRQDRHQPTLTEVRARRVDERQSPTEASEPGPAGQRMVTYPFPVRDGVMAELRLPVDLRKDEATRLGTFLMSLTVSIEPPRQLPPHEPPSQEPPSREPPSHEPRN